MPGIAAMIQAAMATRETGNSGKNSFNLLNISSGSHNDKKEAPDKIPGPLSLYHITLETSRFYGNSKSHSGTRLHSSHSAAKILAALNKLGVEVKLIWSSASSTDDCLDLTLQIDGEHEQAACEALTEMKFEYQVRQR